MTRVLFWNINNFGANGFFPGPNAKQRSVGDDGEYGEPAAPADAADRLDVLLGVIEQVEPDIVSIVEVQPGALGIAPGRLIRDRAAFNLLTPIREREFMGSQHFGLVPPLVSGEGGAAEGVAVYYRTDNLQFLGPYGWDGEQARTVAAIGGAGALGAYPEPWRPGLPNREIPEGWPNAGCREDRLAGQYTFRQFPGAPALRFPGPSSRAPWLTYFRDIARGRLLKLLSFHASPTPQLARLGTRRLAQIPEVTGAIAANEVRCIVGDFNVSSLIAADREDAFGPLTGLANYTLQFNPAGIPAERRAQGYYTTFLKRSQSARPWISDRGGQVVFGYPAFDYMGDKGAKAGKGAIDNALTRHGAGAGEAENATICNPVARSPYDLDPEPPVGVSEGDYVVGTYLADYEILRYDPDDEEWGVDGYSMEADDITEEFNWWQNYTHIRSCSDHLPLALDI